MRKIPEKSWKGRRVRLVSLNDPSRAVKPGDEGTVLVVDALGTMHVEWDNGIGLGLIAEEDNWEFLDSEANGSGNR